MADKKETITPVGPSVAVHEDGEHQCLVRYEGVSEGEDMRGKSVWVRREDGSYEQVSGHSVHGPAQVSSPAYKRGWDETFGKVNSTGGSA